MLNLMRTQNKITEINNLDDYMESIQSKDNLKKCRQYINDLYMNCGMEKMKFIERRLYKVEKNLKLNKEIHFITEQAFSPKFENVINSLNNKLKESEWNNHELMRYFKPECHIQEGQKLESISDLERLKGDKSIRNFQLEEGRIWIIYIWTLYKSICKKQLKLLNDLYEHHLDWEGNVKMVSINTDINREYAYKTVKTLQLNRMEHLYIDSNKYPNHPLFNVVNKYGYPVCILVNSDSIIDLCGSLYEINLEQKIKFLINREIVTTINFYPTEDLIENEKKLLRKIIRNLENSTDSDRDILQASHLCGATLRIKKVYCVMPSNNFMATSLNKIKKSSSNNLLKESNNNSLISSANNISLSGNFSHLLRQGSISSPFRTSKLATKIKGFTKLGLLGILNQEVKKLKPPFQISCEIEYFCHPLDEKKFDDIFQGADQIKRMKIIKNLVQTFEIPYADLNSTCALCEKEILCSHYMNEDNFRHSGNKDSVLTNLNNLNLNESAISLDDVIIQNQYYCPICKLHLCKPCGDLITDLKQCEKIHNHFLYYITPNSKDFMKFILAYNYDNSYEFDFKYFQENKSNEKYVHDVKYHYQVKCDGCLGFPIRTVRWKCSNCLYRNLCDGCKNHVDNRVSPLYESILYNFQVNGCDPIHHVFMKIIFDSFVY